MTTFSAVRTATVLAMMLGASATSVAAEPIESRKIITALSGDFNGDGAPDLAMIVETEPNTAHEMHFFLRDKEHNYLKPVEVVRDQIQGEWNGYDRPGYENSDTEPTLSLLANGSILLEMPDLPFGRERTSQTFTLAYRDGKFVVAGFAYEHHNFEPDADDSDDGFRARCEYNLLTGKGKSAKRNGRGKVVEKPVSVAPQTVSFKDWSFSRSLADCGSSD